MRPNRVGIDLGTTYSSLSCLDDRDKPIPIADMDGDFATPSVVFFPEGGKAPIVGRQAVERSKSAARRTVVHAKRYLGSPDAGWEMDGVVYSPVDISAIIIRKLLRDAEREIGAQIREAVITVPAHFTGHQRQLTIQAGKQAGLEHVNIINEPVAAALRFVLKDFALGEGADVLVENLDDSATTILVYDLGGGTFDLSIVRYDKSQLRVLATSGEQRLGGIDWDEELLNLVADIRMPLIGDLRLHEDAVRMLAPNIERAKRALSKFETATVAIEHDHRADDCPVSRVDFEVRTRPLVERTKILTEELLKSCNLSWDDLYALVPVGGATRMPMIRRVLEGFEKQRTPMPGGFQKRFIIDDIPVDLTVSEGAALFAGMIAQDGNTGATGPFGQALSNYRTQNVSTNDLGMLVLKKGKRINHVLIPRNTPLPANATLAVATSYPNQSRASVKIIEGEYKAENEANVVCRCTIDRLPPGLPENSVFDVDLSYDADGLLHVIATHRDTGRIASVSTLHMKQ